MVLSSIRSACRFVASPRPSSNGATVDLGVSFNAGANQPCGGTFLVTGFVNPGCNAAFSYLNARRTRTNTPTEQLSIQSNYWKDWGLSARFSYSGGDTNVLVTMKTFLDERRELIFATMRLPDPFQANASRPQPILAQRGPSPAN
jgi:hypothetical protein